VGDKQNSITHTPFGAPAKMHLSSDAHPLTDTVKREFYEGTTIDNNINDNDGEHASKKIKLSNDPQT
jgi:hypothetical protein